MRDPFTLPSLSFNGDIMSREIFKLKLIERLKELVRMNLNVMNRYENVHNMD